MATEFEKRIEIRDPDEVADWLQTSFRYLAEEIQIDEYFEPRGKPYLDMSREVGRVASHWLRIRTVSGESTITLKISNYDEDGNYSFAEEHQTKIAESNAMKMILRGAGFRKLVEVRKRRRIWVTGDCEVALDEVDGLGAFVEVEFKGNEAGNSVHALSAITETLRVLPFTWKYSQGGYPELLLKKVVKERGVQIGSTFSIPK
jgi:adenylate cyclase class 2|nr:class IV adenylate cyclase [Neorhizobium tomejilense]